MSNAETARAVQRLMAELGLTLGDLRNAGEPIPSVAEYLPRVIEASGPGAQRTYGNYWARINTALGERKLDQVAASDIEALMRQVMRDQTLRRNGREGVSAGEHLLMAARAMYRRAVADDLVDASRNPAARVRNRADRSPPAVA